MPVGCACVQNWLEARPSLSRPNISQFCSLEIPRSTSLNYIKFVATKFWGSKMVKCSVWFFLCFDLGQKAIESLEGKDLPVSEVIDLVLLCRKCYSWCCRSFPSRAAVTWREIISSVFFLLNNGSRESICSLAMFSFLPSFLSFPLRRHPGSYCVLHLKVRTYFCMGPI